VYGTAYHRRHTGPELRQLNDDRRLRSLAAQATGPWATSVLFSVGCTATTNVSPRAAPADAAGSLAPSPTGHSPHPQPRSSPAVFGMRSKIFLRRLLARFSQRAVTAFGVTNGSDCASNVFMFLGSPRGGYHASFRHSLSGIASASPPGEARSDSRVLRATTGGWTGPTTGVRRTWWNISASLWWPSVPRS
jgi:hypothetical protein